MNTEIEHYEKEIDQLKRDLMYVKNQVSVSAIEYAIKIREISIQNIKNSNQT